MASRTVLGALRQGKELRRVLSLADINVNESDSSGQTGLHLAANEGNEHQVELLVRHGADVNATDRAGWTPLHCAASAGHLGVMELLLQESACTVSLVNDQKTTALHYLVRRAPPLTGESEDVVMRRQWQYRRVLQQMADRGGKTLLNARNNDGETPLHSACLKSNESSVGFLLESGADPNAQTHGGDTCLHYAIHTRNEKLIMMLLQYGANPSLKNAKGVAAKELAETLGSKFSFLVNGGGESTASGLAVKIDPSLIARGEFMDIEIEKGEWRRLWVTRQGDALCGFLTPLHTVPVLILSCDDRAIAESAREQSQSPNGRSSKSPGRELATLHFRSSGGADVYLRSERVAQPDFPINLGVRSHSSDSVHRVSKSASKSSHTSTPRLATTDPGLSSPSQQKRRKNSHRRRGRSPSTRRSTSSSSSSLSSIARQLKRVVAAAPGKQCADCGSVDVTCASVSLGILLCESCATVHRNIFYPSVLSLFRVDGWTRTKLKLVERVLRLDVARSPYSVWAYHVPNEWVISSETVHKKRDDFIRRKYLEGQFRREHNQPVASLDETDRLRLARKAVDRHVTHLQRDYDGLLNTLIRNLLLPTSVTRESVLESELYSQISDELCRPARLNDRTIEPKKPTSMSQLLKMNLEQASRVFSVNVIFFQQLCARGRISVEDLETRTSALLRETMTLLQRLLDTSAVVGSMCSYHALEVLSWYTPQLIELLAVTQVAVVAMPKDWAETVSKAVSHFEQASWMAVWLLSAEYAKDWSSHEVEPLRRLASVVSQPNPPPPPETMYLKVHEELRKLSVDVQEFGRKHICKNPEPNSMTLHFLQTLILEPPYQFVRVILQNHSTREPSTELVDALLSVFDATNSTEILLRVAVAMEVNTTTHAETLFREKTMATSLLSQFIFREGAPYLTTLVLPIINDICAAERPLEVDPAKVDDPSVVSKNFKALIKTATLFVSRLVDSTSQCPWALRRIFHYAREVTVKKFPEMEQMVVGGLLMLRFICPAMIMPKKYGLLDELPSLEAQRALILVSKLLQNLANGVEFDGSKESYMRRFNAFITRNIVRIADFFDELSHVGYDPAQVHQHVPDQRRSARLDRHLKVLHNHVLGEHERLLALLRDGPPRLFDDYALYLVSNGVDPGEHCFLTPSDGVLPARDYLRIPPRPFATTLNDSFVRTLRESNELSAAIGVLLGQVPAAVAECMLGLSLSGSLYGFSTLTTEHSSLSIDLLASTVAFSGDHWRKVFVPGAFRLLRFALGLFAHVKSAGGSRSSLGPMVLLREVVLLGGSFESFVKLGRVFSTPGSQELHDRLVASLWQLLDCMASAAVHDQRELLEEYLAAFAVNFSWSTTVLCAVEPRAS